MKPFFSIIIPVYNVARAPLRALRVAYGNVPCGTSSFGAFYLRECRDSVLAQTFTDREAICVDDGSTDGSGAILDGYAAKGKLPRVVHQADKGASTARNHGLDDARGRIFGFLRKALTQYRKVESSLALLRLFDNHDNLLNKKSHLTRALAMYCRLSDWLGIPTPNVRSKIQPYFMRKRFHGNKKHKH